MVFKSNFLKTLAFWKKGSYNAVNVIHLTVISQKREEKENKTMANVAWDVQLLKKTGLFGKGEDKRTKEEEALFETVWNRLNEIGQVLIEKIEKEHGAGVLVTVTPVAGKAVFDEPFQRSVADYLEELDELTLPTAVQELMELYVTGSIHSNPEWVGTLTPAETLI